jgi:hypothetical protein
MDRYLKYESAGDMFVGRTVSGLPLHKSDFEVLPPHFKFRDYEESRFVSKWVELLFPICKKIRSFQLVCQFLLASILYHFEFLDENLHPSHILRSTAIFENIEMRTKLKSLVHLNSDELLPTGIPLYVSLLNTAERIEDYQKQMGPMIIEEVVSGVAQEIEARGAAAGNISHDLLKNMLTNLIKEARDLRVEVTNEVEQEANKTSAKAFVWGGRFHPIPEDFTLPSVPVRTAWNLWYHGKQSEGIGPYMTFKNADFSNDKTAKQFREWKKCFNYIKVFIMENHPQLYQEHPTLEQSCEMFDSVCPHLERVFNCSRKRRMNEIKVLTLARSIKAKHI